MPASMRRIASRKRFCTALRARSAAWPARRSRPRPRRPRRRGARRVRVGMAARSGEAPVANEDCHIEGADASPGDASHELLARFPETALAFELRLRDRGRRRTHLRGDTFLRHRRRRGHDRMRRRVRADRNAHAFVRLGRALPFAEDRIRRSTVRRGGRRGCGSDGCVFRGRRCSGPRTSPVRALDKRVHLSAQRELRRPDRAQCHSRNHRPRAAPRTPHRLVAGHADRSRPHGSALRLREYPERGRGVRRGAQGRSPHQGHRRHRGACAPGGSSIEAGTSLCRSTTHRRGS